MTPQEAYWIAQKACKRLPELEGIIMTDYRIACYYAEVVVGGRWIEAEDIIMTDPRYIYLYAKYVIEGNLPEKMHNMMILHAIKDSNDVYVKEYFEYISK